MLTRVADGAYVGTARYLTDVIVKDGRGPLEVPVHDLAEFDCSPLIQGIKSEPMRFSGCIAMLLGEAPARPLELLTP